VDDVRCVGPASAGDAVSILREAAAHFAKRGIDVWTGDELRDADFIAAASAGHLYLGYAGAQAVATMLLQPADLLYWPEAKAGSGLYIHKVAVRRAAAGRGWLARLIDHAVSEAVARGVPFLRLDTLEGPTLRSFYERLGFSALNEPPIEARGRRLIRMERRL
jgi:GNAT superfamily N-acetyltransferase